MILRPEQLDYFHHVLGVKAVLIKPEPQSSRTASHPANVSPAIGSITAEEVSSGLDKVLIFIAEQAESEIAMRIAKALAVTPQQVNLIVLAGNGPLTASIQESLPRAQTKVLAFTEDRLTVGSLLRQKGASHTLINAPIFFGPRLTRVQNDPNLKRSMWTELQAWWQGSR